MPETTLRGAVDTWAWSARDATNYADARKLGIASGAAYAYIYFSSPVPRGAIVTSAKLRLYHAESWSAVNTTITAARLAEQLKASRVTWNNKPGVTGATATVVDPGGPAGQLVELEVKALVQAVADGAPWHGFRLASSAVALKKLWSSEGSSTYRPTLAVEWSEAPQAPTGLTPNGGKAVSSSKPLLRFQTTDTLGDTTLAAINVQISTDPAFGTIAHDSGWVTTDLPEHNLAGGSFALPAGVVRYWRVRVRDGAGLESEWSDEAALSYVAHSAVTILNPASGGAPFVSDPTPRILWSFAGTQTRWQVLILDAADPTVVLADSGERVGTETAWTPPVAKALPSTGPYRVEVRVWDGVLRVPSDPFAKLTRDFTVTDDGTVTSVSALAATQPNPWPGVTLTWTRSSAPDSFVLVRDGITLNPELLPEDALVSGTSYRWVDPGARVWRPHTWEVKAKVNGQQSDSTVVTITPTTRGIWLVDELNGRRVWLAGLDGGTWSRPEDASAMTPIGASQVVRRVQGVRNYEGSLGGQLVDAYGRTAASYEADLEAIRKAGKPVHLSVADLTLKVLLGNVQTSPTQHIPPSRLVAFDFWEVA